MNDATITPTVPHGTYLAEYARTPKTGAARKMKKEPMALMSAALELHPTIYLNNEAMLAYLLERGLTLKRIPNAVYMLKKYYGVNVTAIRQGRKVIAYKVEL